ncbi:MAG: TAT pathway signal sequence [Coriobacteriia bacterium]|nr:TAT pathway signal sequence [Coriobacteriia bacterium]
MELTRRDFMKGTTVLAFGALGAYALGGCAASGGNPPAASGGGAAPKKVTLHRGYFSAHTSRSYAQAVVAVDESGKIVACDIEDFQLMDSAHAWTPVPNSKSDLGKGYAAGMVLISKKDNDKVLSKWMADEGGSKQLWSISMAAIEAFVVGKSPADLTSVKIDDISGATLVDRVNYVKGVAAVAADNTLTTEGSFDGDASEIRIGHVDAVCHGTFAFANAVSLVHSDTFVGVSIDEFQFLDAKTAGLISVPNSDKLLGQSYAAGQMLMSKSINSKIYSEHMVGATKQWLDSMKAIEKALVGQKVSSVSVDSPDDVSGATLADTANYVKAAVSAAKAAKG